MENHEWKRVNASIIITVFFIITCIAALTCIDGIAGGYAIAFVSFFIALWGIAVTALFIHRARVMDAILNSNHLLAHWIYPAEIARDRAQREYTNYQERNRAMFILIGGMLVVVSLVFILLWRMGVLSPVYSFWHSRSFFSSLQGLPQNSN